MQFKASLFRHEAPAADSIPIRVPSSVRFLSLRACKGRYGWPAGDVARVRGDTTVGYTPRIGSSCAQTASSLLIYGSGSTPKPRMRRGENPSDFIGRVQDLIQNARRKQPKSTGTEGRDFPKGMRRQGLNEQTFHA